jgi:hypothetical protein
MQNNAIIALMQQFMPGFTMDEMEFGPEEFEAEALGMYEDFVRSRPAPKPKARKAGSAGGGSSAPRKRTKKATPRPLIELPPSYEEDGSAAAAGQLIMASAPTEILSKAFLLLGPLNSYGQLSLVNKHWREALQVTDEHSIVETRVRVFLLPVLETCAFMDLYCRQCTSDLLCMLFHTLTHFADA